MAITYALINKNTLSYICSNKGVTPEFIISRTKLNSEKIKHWLIAADPSLPTIRQAKTLSSCLHIPFAGLYMNPEDIPLPKIPSIRNMRTMQDRIIDDSALNIAMLDVLLERDFLIKTNEEFGIDPTAFIMAAPKTNDPITWADTIRKKLSITLEKQYQSTSSRQFYLYLRNQVEAAGIFVHCFTDVEVECARGFAIYKPVLPVIGVNDQDRPPAKSFTLIHELVHLLKRDSSLCNDMNTSPRTDSEEVFCNAVAGELLVPRKALELHLHNEKYASPFSTDDIKKMATRFSVSREVIIRRLLDLDKIDTSEFDTYSDIFRRELEQEREERRIARQNGKKNSISRNISREALDRTSPSISKVLYHGYVEEVFSKQDIARHLGIDQKHINKYLAEVATWIR